MRGNKRYELIVKILKLGEDRIGVSFPYNPEYIQKIKTIEGHLWRPDGKY